MVEGSVREASDSPERPTRHDERLATLIEGDRELLLASYEQALADSRSPVMADRHSREQTLASCMGIIADIAESVRAGAVRIDEYEMSLARTIGQTRAAVGLSAADSMQAAVTFFNVTSATLSRHLRDDPALLPSFVLAITALNESLNQRTREACFAYTTYLLDCIHRANLDERHRIARELHDRLGEGLSGALRQLELRELTGPDEPVEPALHATLAKTALMDAMDRLRFVISDLRRDPVTSLEKALTDYIASISPDIEVRLQVNGDESFVPPTITDEAFMIIREALRNALAHAAAHLVLICVDLTPYELRASVEDDGRGMRLRGKSTVRSAGLATMHERAALLGGSLNVSSSPGQGTFVELLVPLQGSR